MKKFIPFIIALLLFAGVLLYLFISNSMQYSPHSAILSKFGYQEQQIILKSSNLSSNLSEPTTIHYYDDGITIDLAFKDALGDNHTIYANNQSYYAKWDDGSDINFDIKFYLITKDENNTIISKNECDLNDISLESNDNLNLKLILDKNFETTTYKVDGNKVSEVIECQISAREDNSISSSYYFVIDNFISNSINIRYFDFDDMKTKNIILNDESAKYNSIIYDLIANQSEYNSYKKYGWDCKLYDSYGNLIDITNDTISSLYYNDNGYDEKDLIIEAKYSKEIKFNFISNGSILESYDYEFTYSPNYSDNSNVISIIGEDVTYIVSDFVKENISGYILENEKINIECDKYGAQSIELQPGYLISYELDGGINASSNPTSYTIETTTITLAEAAKEGYTFAGWYTDDSFSTNVTEITKGATGDITLYAKWLANSYTITLDVNGGDELAQTTFTVIYGNEYQFSYEPTRTGYTFEGWYYNDEKIGYYSNDDNAWYLDSWNIADNVTLTAKWTANPYTITLDVNGGDELESATLEVAYNDEFTLPTPTRTGYTFEGWYNGDSLVESGTYNYTSNITLTAKWSVITYIITYELDGGTNASINPTTYTINDNITFADATKEGYTFEGWYSNDSFSTKVILIAENTTTGNITLYALWDANSYTITFDVNGGDELESTTLEVAYNDEFTLPTPTKTGYTFAGWYNGDTLVESGTYNYTSNITLIAKWISIISYMDTYGYLRVDSDGNADEDGTYLYFGTYPQTKVSDETLISSLTTLAGTEPTTDAANGFTSYKYYISSSNTTDYMWYKDITYDSDTYRCVYFTSYRPYFTSFSSSESYSYQDDNGYSTSTYYFFKFEPIKWQILTESNGTATILADLILDSQDYNYTSSSQTVDGTTVYGNNYEYSSIRAWLNDTFYNTAFTELQQAIINTVEVDNSASTTDDSSNSYACSNTSDKVWLLSYQEAYSTYFSEDTERKNCGTDYAKCQGLWVNSVSGYSLWWFRSPDSSHSYYALFVNNCGYFHWLSVDYTDSGVVPALTITL